MAAIEARTAPTPKSRGRSCVKPSGARLLAHLEGLDHVADLRRAETAQGQTTLEALPDLGRVVLEPLERADRDVVRHHGAVAQDARLGVAADETRPDETAGDETDLGRAEDLTDLRGAQLDLLVLRLEQALERGLDLLDGLVDDAVVADLHVGPVGHLLDLVRGPDVEADDRGGGVRGRARQVHVALGDRTDAAVDDLELDLVRNLDLEQRVLESLDRTRAVALEHQGERGLLALLELLHERLESRLGTRVGEARRATAGLPLLGDLPDGAVVLAGEERVARAGHRGETEHQHRPRREGLGHLVAVLVEHGADAAVRAAPPQR